MLTSNELPRLNIIELTSLIQTVPGRSNSGGGIMSQ
jgi:hypothetical protein